jgi:hypothetical protein
MNVTRQPVDVCMNPISMRSGGFFGVRTVPVEFPKRPVCRQPLGSSSIRLPRGSRGPAGNTAAAARVSALRAARRLGAASRLAAALAADGGCRGGTNRGGVLPPQPDRRSAATAPNVSTGVLKLWEPQRRAGPKAPSTAALVDPFEN